MADMARAVWESLNTRQQIYLQALLDVDQAAERARRSEGARGRWSNTPAREWRRIQFNDPLGSVVSRLRSAGVYDSGAGSTLAVLRERGLIETQTVPGLLNDAVMVWVTAAGRKAVRAHQGGGGAARTPRPKWAVSEWLWRQLVKVAGAGPEGLAQTELQGEAHLYLCDGWEHRRGNRPYLASHSRWVRHTAYADFRRTQTYETSTQVFTYRFTDAGRAHYRERLAEYRELYPNIAAPDLPELEEHPLVPGDDHLH
ncbi:hypothetical protein ACH4U5_31135 [Streptomyces sp. NPDC020858]|uniref:hypothetical protein n=1 Tax=Streptomyces sp. NPDC020858 TaxID=3365097 RepID=UPI0037BB76CA